MTQTDTSNTLIARIGSQGGNPYYSVSMTIPQMLKYLVVRSTTASLPADQRQQRPPSPLRQRRFAEYVINNIEETEPYVVSSLECEVATEHFEIFPSELDGYATVRVSGPLHIQDGQTRYGGFLIASNVLQDKINTDTVEVVIRPFQDLKKSRRNFNALNSGAAISKDTKMALKDSAEADTVFFIYHQSRHNMVDMTLCEQGGTEGHWWKFSVFREAMEAMTASLEKQGYTRQELVEMFDFVVDQIQPLKLFNEGTITCKEKGSYIPFDPTFVQAFFKAFPNILRHCKTHSLDWKMMLTSVFGSVEWSVQTAVKPEDSVWIGSLRRAPVAKRRADGSYTMETRKITGGNSVSRAANWFMYMFGVFQDDDMRSSVEQHYRQEGQNKRLPRPWMTTATSPKLTGDLVVVSKLHKSPAVPRKPRAARSVV